MKRVNMILETTTVTRRAMLGSTLACALASMVPQKMLAQITSNRLGETPDLNAAIRSSAKLFAFPGQRSGTTVIAATWPVRLNRFDRGTPTASQVTVHAGVQNWNVTLPAGTADAHLLEQNGCRIFSGTVSTQSGKNGVALKAVVIEIPTKQLGKSGSVDIWAERVTPAGMRQRVGSPFVAVLVAENHDLANLYHATSPDEDRIKLTTVIADAIAAKARTSETISDADAHGRRLAARLLPDVLHYDPQRPAGFTFAAQNGLHPEEVSGLIVDTILNGSPAIGSAKLDICLQKPFPFFARYALVA